MNFLRFLEVPKRSHQCLTMAMLPPDTAVEAEVAGQGWRLTGRRPVSAGMAAYGDFIRGSRGEFTVAKAIYVRPNSGWCPERRVCRPPSRPRGLRPRTSVSR